MNDKDMKVIKDILKDWRPDIRLLVVKVMRASGKTQQEIADTIGTTRQNVQQMLKEKK